MNRDDKLITMICQPKTSLLMGPTEIPSQSTEVIKIPTSNYEFGANFIDPKVTEHLIYYAVLS